VPLPIWYLKADPKPSWKNLPVDKRRHLLECCTQNIRIATRYGDTKSVLVNQRWIEESVGPLDRN